MLYSEDIPKNSNISQQCPEPILHIIKQCCVIITSPINSAPPKYNNSKTDKYYTKRASKFSQCRNLVKSFIEDNPSTTKITIRNNTLDLSVLCNFFENYTCASTILDIDEKTKCNYGPENIFWN